MFHMLYWQIKKAEDIVFQNILGRVRAAILTEDDLILLNSKTTMSLLVPEIENTTTVVKLNVLCQYRIFSKSTLWVY